MNSAALNVALSNDRCLYFAFTNDGGAIFDQKHDCLFKLTPVAAEIWELLQQGKSEAETVIEIAARYNVDQQRVKADVAALLRQSTQLGFTPADTRVSETVRTSSLLPKPQESITLQDDTAPTLMTISAFLSLVAFDLILFMFSFDTMCRIVKTRRVRGCSREPARIAGQVCSAVQKACVWFPHKAVCLQRSAVTTCLLRTHGIEAHMVVGIRPMPFLAHAWTEVDGVVVNDRPQVKAFYQTLTVY